MRAGGLNSIWRVSLFLNEWRMELPKCYDLKCADFYRFRFEMQWLKWKQIVLLSFIDFNPVIEMKSPRLAMNRMSLFSRLAKAFQQNRTIFTSPPCFCLTSSSNHKSEIIRWFANASTIRVSLNTIILNNVVPFLWCADADSLKEWMYE